MLVEIYKNKKLIGQFDCLGVVKENGVINIYLKDSFPISFCNYMDPDTQIEIDNYDYLIK